jgi:hypothetical protein
MLRMTQIECDLYGGTLTGQLGVSAVRRHGARPLALFRTIGEWSRAAQCTATGDPVSAGLVTAVTR